MDNLGYEKYFLYALVNKIKPIGKEEFFKIYSELGLDNYKKEIGKEGMPCT